MRIPLQGNSPARTYLSTLRLPALSVVQVSNPGLSAIRKVERCSEKHGDDCTYHDRPTNRLSMKTAVGLAHSGQKIVTVLFFVSPRAEHVRTTPQCHPPDQTGG